MLASLFGCKGTKEYTAKDIEAISISCGEMDLRSSYSFALSLKEDTWILYADCFSIDGETEINLKTPIENEEAENLLALAEKSGFISSLRKYRKPLFKPSTADEAVYSSSITLSDGNTFSAPILSSRDVETNFYALAEKYGKNNY